MDTSHARVAWTVVEDAQTLERVRRFTRETLRCTCPDRTFEHVERKGPGVPEARRCDLTRLIIGRRLLVSVLVTDDPALLRARLAPLLEEGMRGRDDRSLNRFRAVVATDAPDLIGPLARRIAAETLGDDERAHLHLVARAEVASL
jgi:hypothetical protein